MKTKKTTSKKPATKVGTPGDTGLIIGDYFIAPGHKRMILMADHKQHGVWLAGVGDYLDDDWYGSRAEFDAAGWTPVNASALATASTRHDQHEG